MGVMVGLWKGLGSACSGEMTGDSQDKWGWGAMTGYLQDSGSDMTG